MEKQILLVSTMGSVQRAVWRICILILESKRLKVEILEVFSPHHLPIRLPPPRVD